MTLTAGDGLRDIGVPFVRRFPFPEPTTAELLDGWLELATGAGCCCCVELLGKTGAS